MTGQGGRNKLLGPPKVFFFHAPFLTTSLPTSALFLPLPSSPPLPRPFSISCGCCWCDEISIADYLVNFKLISGDLAEVAIVCSDIIFIYIYIYTYSACVCVCDNYVILFDICHSAWSSNEIAAIAACLALAAAKASLEPLLATAPAFVAFAASSTS